MNKKLLAVAVAGVLAAPAVALAQSSVTISGTIKMSVEGYKISNASATRAGTNDSQTLLADDSSRVLFNVVEDLGGGLQAIAQLDWRVPVDSGADTLSGNNHIGLRSKQWGRIIFGRQDLHYFGRESDFTARNTLRGDSVSLLAFAGGGGSAVAGATRTTNVIHYTTPSLWGGFSAIVAYSFNPTTAESDIGSTTRKGRAWNVAPVYEAANWTLGYSYWSQKADGIATVPAVPVGAVVPTAPWAAANNSDQRGDRLFGSYRWGGFRVGLAWDKSKLKGTVAGATRELSNRTAWSIPVEYSWGPHWIGGHYTQAKNDKDTTCTQSVLAGGGALTAAQCAAGLDKDGAKMWSIGYNYSLSKRTSVGISWTQIKNDPGAFYLPFTTAGGLGSATNAIQPGEDPRLWAMTIRHAF